MADRMRGPLPQDALIIGSDGTVIGVLYDYDDRTIPNARLIAEAPDLLNALKEIVDDLEARWNMRDPRTNPGIRDNVDRARNIIAKVEGGE